MVNNNQTNRNVNRNMNLAKLSSVLPIFIGVALFIFTIGLSLFYIEGHFNLFTLSLASSLTFTSFIISIALISFYYRINTRGANAVKTTSYETIKRWPRTMLIFSIIVGSVVFLGAINYGANSFSTRWDVTENKQHTLSKNTVDFISTLKENVELTALYVGLPPKYLQDLLNEYNRISHGLITVSIIDPIENISVAAKFGNVVNGKEQKVIVQSINGRKDVDFTDNPLTEEKLTNAIARASRLPQQVYFVNGHGEYKLSNTENTGLSTFKQLLADNNIHSKPLMLGISQAIPDDCDVLVIAGPRAALTLEEETLIVNYLAAGGDALFLIEHTVVTTPEKPLTAAQLKQNPSLNSILNQWGLNVESDVVVDLTNHVGKDVGSPATKNYQKHEALTAGLDYTFYVRPRSIKVLDQRRANIKLAAIASTASKDKSWAETNRNLAIQFDQGVDTPGPIPISYVVLETHPEKTNAVPLKQTKISDTRIILVTDADFLTNVYINQYSNAQMGLNMINWLAELDYQAFVSAKKVKVEHVNLTSKQKRQVLVVLFLLPFFFMLVGGVVWLKLKSTD